MLELFQKKRPKLKRDFKLFLFHCQFKSPLCESFHSTGYISSVYWGIFFVPKHMDDQKILALRDLIHSAQVSISSAKKILKELLWDVGDEDSFLETDGLATYHDGDNKIIEWVFTGESMLGSDGALYPVPQNYASKSLLVQWSKLKAIIQPNGKIIYKIIGEIPYESQVGIVVKNGEKYQITTEIKTYNVLLAAITFHHCNVWDTVSIRVPEWKDATYAVIETVIPKK